MVKLSQVLHISYLILQETIRARNGQLIILLTTYFIPDALRASTRASLRVRVLDTVKTNRQDILARLC